MTISFQILQKKRLALSFSFFYFLHLFFTCSNVRCIFRLVVAWNSRLPHLLLRSQHLLSVLFSFLIPVWIIDQQKNKRAKRQHVGNKSRKSHNAVFFLYFIIRDSFECDIKNSQSPLVLICQWGPIEIQTNENHCSTFFYHQGKFHCNEIILSVRLIPSKTCFRAPQTEDGHRLRLISLLVGPFLAFLGV